MTTPGLERPPASAPDDMDGLLAEVDYYESLPQLDAADFDCYARAEGALAAIIMTEATLRQKEFSFAAAEELFGRFIQLNEMQRRICERERRHDDGDVAYLARLARVRDAAAANCILAEGLKHACQAGERRLAGDFDMAVRHLAAAMKHFGQLADSELPLQAAGARRYASAEAASRTMTGLAHMRDGDFKGARQCFATARVAFDELKDRVGQDEDVRAEVLEALRYLQAVQSFAETLRESQNGNYGDAVLSGGEAVAHYERLLRDAMARQVPRNAQSLYALELARVKGWLSWASAELAVDEGRWAQCRDLVRQARGHWNDAAHEAARIVFTGIVTQRPEAGDTDMLLQNTLRRCERELTFRKQIDALNAKLDSANKIVMQIQGGQGGHAVAPGDNVFNAPVNAGIIGNENRVEHSQANQNVAGGADLRELAAQLAELRGLLAAAARTADEQKSVTAVAAAQECATRGDEAGVRSHLAAAGQWALRIGEQIGLALATAAIKSSLGV